MKKLVILFGFLLMIILFNDCGKKKKTSCSDGIKNQDEVFVDCGGVCSACESCSDGIKNQNETAIDCGGVCAACQTCSDGIQNQGETSVDCGGPCTVCPTCSDGIQNQNETGIDCGGPCSPCTPTNPATQNTSLLVGGAGWTNTDCSSTNSLSLKSMNGSITVTLNFAAMTSGTYMISSGTPTAGTCALTLNNAPSQPSNITWYGKNGSVVVSATSSSISATINNVICTQQSFNFPVVTVNGTMECQP